MFVRIANEVHYVTLSDQPTASAGRRARDDEGGTCVCRCDDCDWTSQLS